MESSQVLLDEAQRPHQTEEPDALSSSHFLGGDSSSSDLCRRGLHGWLQDIWLQPLHHKGNSQVDSVRA